jgi:hypothetical protein
MRTWALRVNEMNSPEGGESNNVPDNPNMRGSTRVFLATSQQGVQVNVVLDASFNQGGKMADEFRSAEARGERGATCPGPWVPIAEAIYKAVTSGRNSDVNHAMEALRATGRSDAEALTLYNTAASIARKSGNAAVFMGVLRGDAEVPAKLSRQEVAMLGGISRASRVSGRTWEGSSGDTWEGSSGDTWVGSAR